MPILNSTLSPLSVLVVDDAADTADSLAELLTYFGYSVRVALGGARAVRLAVAERPNVVLLGVRMPRVDGCAAARQIREGCASGRLPLLVAVSGCGEEDVCVRASGVRFDVYLVKPVQLGTMLGVLDCFRRLAPRPLKATDPTLSPDEEPSVADEPKRARRNEQSERSRASFSPVRPSGKRTAGVVPAPCR